MREESEEKRVHLLSEILSLDRQYAEGRIDENTYAERRKALEAELTNLEKPIEALEEEVVPSKPDEYRFREYAKEEVQTLLRMLLNENTSRLTPIYDFNLVTGYRYPEAEKKLKENSAEAVETIKRLSSLKVLTPKFFDKLYHCPRCDSPAIQHRFLCIKCESRNLSRAPSIEHLNCGYIGFEHEFNKNDRLICPKCRKELRQIGVDYSKPGYGYKCNECGAAFPNPLLRIYCTNCKGFFNQDELVEKDTYEYTLTEELKPEIVKALISLESLVNFLTGLDFKVETPGLRWGVSGIEHRFDLIAMKTVNGARKTTILQALISNTPIKPDAVLEVYMKTFDVKADAIVIVAIPRLTQEARIAAENYGIEISEGEKLQSALDKLKELKIWKQHYD